MVGNFLFSIISSIIVFYLNEKFIYLMIALSAYGSLRVFEVIVYQINVVFLTHIGCMKLEDSIKLSQYVG